MICNMDLTLNSLMFEFPQEPVNFYFSREFIAGCHLTRIVSEVLRPDNIKTIFPDLNEGQEIYTSFDDEHEGMIPLAVDLRIEKNYYLAKRYYNRLIRNYFLNNDIKCVITADAIIKDNEVWIKSKEAADFKDSTRFDRFSLKVDYDHFNKHPQLVLSYYGATHVLNKSVSALFQAYNDNFEFNSTGNSLSDVISKVIYNESHLSKDGNPVNKLIADKYIFLASHRSDFNSRKAYPVLNRSLRSFLGYSSPSNTVLENHIRKYYDKIKHFYETYLNNDVFRGVVPISASGFSPINESQVNMTSQESKSLLFGHGQTNYNPTMGLNNGPYLPVPAAKVELICVFHKEESNFARFLMQSLHKGYGAYKNYNKSFVDPLTGIQQYDSDVLRRFTGKDTEFAHFFIEFTNKNDPYPEVNRQLLLAFENGKLKRDSAYMALYVSPIKKTGSSGDARKAYSRIKDAFLRQNIMTQVITTDNIGKVNPNKYNEKGEKEIIAGYSFAYTLQNMALAICAKMGGIPWKINVQKKKELVVGIGAFRNQEDGATYIGSAFSFDNTGSFNAFECFLQDEMLALVGSIKQAIINFSSVNGKPDRLVIHYYKIMSRNKEYAYIDDMLQSLDFVDMPVYVVTVNKTDSEDFVAFDLNDQSLLPYSGTYINLGKGKYLLCNNTRYPNFKGRIEAYPFPIKMRIWSPKIGEEQISTTVIQELIEQVFQFSRIYFKSVKQQHLPVTLKYPELLSEMLSSFDNLATNHLDSNKLWFL